MSKLPPEHLFTIFFVAVGGGLAALIDLANAVIANITSKIANGNLIAVLMGTDASIILGITVLAAGVVTAIIAIIGTVMAIFRHFFGPKD